MEIFVNRTQTDKRKENSSIDYHSIDPRYNNLVQNEGVRSEIVALLDDSLSMGNYPIGKLCGIIDDNNI